MNLERVRSETHTRSLPIEHRSVDEKRRTVELAFSSEQPYLRWFGWEILDHGSDSIRLDRLRSAGALLMDHNTRDQVGVVESVSIGADKLARAVVRFGQGARASEIFQDVIDGIRRSISVGYSVHDMVLEKQGDEQPTYRVTDWEPLEISIVAVPADDSVGVGRSHGVNIMNPKPSEKVSAEAERISEITRMGEEHDLQEFATRYIAEGISADDAAARFVVQLNARHAHKGGDIKPVDLSGSAGAASAFDLQRYSLQSAIRSIVDPKANCGGFEREVSQELQRNSGRRSDGLIVPIEALQTRANTAAGSAGNLIGTDHLDGQFIDVLRPRSRVVALGATILSGLQGNVSIPRKTASSTAGWIAGDNADSLSESDPTFDAVTLTPKTVGVVSTYSRLTLLQTSPGIEQILRDDLMQAVGTAIDIGAIGGSGAANQPLGILNTTGVSTTAFVGATPTYAEVVAMETELAEDNADVGSLGYLFTPTIGQGLKTTEVASGTGIFVWSKGTEAGVGTVNTYRAMTSGNVPAGQAIFADWASLLIGMWSGIELDVDPYGSNFAKGSVSVRAISTIDVGVRHAESFCIKGA